MKHYVTTCDACGTLRFGEWIEVGKLTICPGCVDSEPLTDDERAALPERREQSSCPTAHDGQHWYGAADACVRCGYPNPWRRREPS